MTQRIVCAAVLYPDYSGTMLVGPRHFDKVMLDQYMRFFGGGNAPGEAPGENEGVCGLLDQDGRFFTRQEAYVIAKKAGQVAYPDEGTIGKLFSENLYSDIR